ncbi:MAG: SDR family oxidoreductase [Blastochloris sp.]|nr:SDR family oxidoreductase [Blastochloris sp.]
MLRNEIVLLTGAGGGFGKILTRLFLLEGCRLILADRSKAAALQAAEQAAHAAAAASGKVIGICAADLGTSEGAAQLWAEASAISGRIDILINNAGIGLLGRIDTIPQELWERLMQINLLAPMRLTSLALPGMLTRRHGRIVNIASSAGMVGAAGFGAYSASKFGLRGFSESLGRDLRGSGVSVTAIYPFFARTAILDSPQYGYGRRRMLPGWMVDDPEMVMAALLRGMKRRQRHIYPSRMAWIVKWIRRLSA